jgi:hypothetical protein
LGKQLKQNFKFKGIPNQILHATAMGHIPAPQIVALPVLIFWIDLKKLDGH